MKQGVSTIVEIYKGHQTLSAFLFFEKENIPYYIHEKEYKFVRFAFDDPFCPYYTH